jgi:hypothetical protein
MREVVTLTYRPWQKSAFISSGVLAVIMGALTWAIADQPGTQDRPLAVAGAGLFGLLGAFLCANAFLLAVELTPSGFTVRGLWRRRWSWSDIERFYVIERTLFRGFPAVGYVPTAGYIATHPLARVVAALNLGRYALPAVSLDAYEQVVLMTDWLRRYR